MSDSLIEMPISRIKSNIKHMFLHNPPEEGPKDSWLLLSGPPCNDFKLDNVFDFSHICRICAAKVNPIVPIYESYGKDTNLAAKINAYLPITVSPTDKLPLKVCSHCMHMVLAWHELAKVTREADEALRERYQEVEKILEEEKKLGIKREEKKCSPTSGTDSAPAGLGARRDTELADECDSAASDRSTDEDRPLARLVAEKPKKTFRVFYDALVEFRDHFVSQHRTRRRLAGDTNESSDSELKTSEERDSAESDYDDLSVRSMRRDRLDAATRRQLAAALERGGGGARPAYRCSECGKRLASAHTFLFHARIHRGERPCVCHVCGKSFRTPPALRRHLTETHERARRRACRLCAKTFANAHNLKQHLRTHTGERPYACARCPRRFAHSGSLHAHRRTHEAGAALCCPRCAARFRAPAALARHRCAPAPPF